MEILPDHPTLADLQKNIGLISAERGWDKNSLTQTFLLFSEEMGELAKEVRKFEGLHYDRTKADRGDLEEEFADVLNYLLDLANQMGVDLEKAYRKKQKINEARSWS